MLNEDERYLIGSKVTWDDSCACHPQHLVSEGIVVGFETGAYVDGCGAVIVDADFEGTGVIMPIDVRIDRVISFEIKERKP